MNIMRFITIIVKIFRLIKKYPKVFLWIFIPLILLPFYEIFIARPNMVYMGVPKSDNFVRVFRNSSFMLGYSNYRGNPLWVTYKLTQISKDRPKYKRPKK